MMMKTRIIPTIEFGRMSASARFEDPVVRVAREDDSTLEISEGGILVQLEFTGIDALYRFRDQIAAMALPETKEGEEANEE